MYHEPSLTVINIPIEQMAEGCYSFLDEGMYNINTNIDKKYFETEIFERKHIADAREMFIEIDHPVIGKMKVNGSPIKLMDTMPRINIPAPTLGQHNHEILVETLKYTEEDYSFMEEQGII